MTTHTTDAREAAAIEYRNLDGNHSTAEWASLGRYDKVYWLQKSNRIIDAFLTTVLEGADERVAEIQMKLAHNQNQFPGDEYEPKNWIDEEISFLLNFVTALSAKLKEVEAARASQMEEGDHPKDCRCEVCRAWGA